MMDLSESPIRTSLFVLSPAVVNAAAGVRAVKVSCPSFQVSKSHA